MKKIALFILTFVFFATACDGPQKGNEIDSASLKDAVHKQEEIVFAANQNRIQKEEAEILIGLYEKYAYEFPADSLSPGFLFRASDISMNLRKPKQTIVLFDRILNDYPDFAKAAAVLFLKAFVYEDQLQDYENAKKYYELFISKYPDSDFADDAEVSLKNLGKSPEELILEFESNQ